MDGTLDLDRLKPRKPVAVVAFAVLLVAASTTYGVTAVGHYDAFRTEKVDGRVVNYHVSEDEYGTVIVVKVKVHNPLLRPIRIGGASLQATADGEVVAGLGDVYQGVTVPATGTKTLRLEMRPAQNESAAAARAARRGNLHVTGSFQGMLGVEYKFSFGVRDATGASSDD